MGSSYRQFCPVAKAMELFDERWTLLIVRELVLGSEHFNELRRGLPRLSPTLLSKRLHQLTVAGIVERTANGSDVRYVLTPAGRGLEPVVEALGTWGARWTGRLGDQDLDPTLLMWDMHRCVDRTVTPDSRTIVQFTFLGTARASRRWWMVITSGDVDVCDEDPGFEVTVRVIADLRALTEIWRGELGWSHALRSGAVVIDGPVELRRSLPTWFVPRSFGAAAPSVAAPLVSDG